MFGRLSEKKKKAAINLMVETTETLSRTLIIWATGEFKTPKKPFIDDLYLFCSAMLSSNYLAWRKLKSDAYIDIKRFVDLIFAHVFQEHKENSPFRSEKQNLDDFLAEIHTRMDGNILKIEAALRNEVNNIAVELGKYRRAAGASTDPHMQYMHALTTAEHPFKEAIIQNLFDIDQRDEKTLGDYDNFASQASSLLIRYDDIFRKGLLSL